MNANRIKQRLITTLRQRGDGVLGLVNSFREFDTDGNGSLSWEEFCNAMQKSGLNPSPQDIRTLFIDMDKDGNNEISFREFLESIRGTLSESRRNIIINIFNGIDSDCDGVITMADIGACFVPKNHPDVKSGRKPVPILLKEFLETFSTVSSNGRVTMDEFLEYYANVAAFQDDETFNEIMSSIWNLSKTSQKSGPKTLQSLADKQATASALSVDSILNRFKETLISRGAIGIIGLQRKFKIIDDDNNKSLSFSEFKKAIREHNLSFSDIELSQLFNNFDKDKSGSIDFEEFLVGIRGVLNPRRQALVDMAFTVLDKRGKGVVEPEDIIGVYDASKHPDVIAGKRTPNEVLKEFLETFDVGGEIDGKVTRGEFSNYYANISASIDDDDYFELMIRNAWHISGGQGWSANSSNKRVLVTRPDGSQSVEEIKNDLGLKQGDTTGMLSRLKAQGINASSVSSYDGLDNTSKPKPRLVSKEEKAELAKKLARLGLSEKDTVLSKEAILVAKGGPQSGSRPLTSSPLNTKFIDTKSIPNAGLLHIVNKLKESIRSHGGNGFIALQRKFRIMDDDGDKQLNLAEFKKGMKELQLNTSDSELRMLFDYFDKDNSATINFEEFIQGLRDPLNDRRLALVEMAFAKLDVSGDGLVDGEEIAKLYDASKHPEVIAGRMTPQQVFDHFLETFDVGGEVDGKVTKAEFVNYYTNIGANIDNDDYFELMIRNAWHISGGEGWAANSANKRVLVTRADGSQYVEEIKNDLGLKQGDTAAMISRLKAQGVDASSIALYGTGEDNSKSTLKPTSLRNLSSNKSNIVSKNEKQTNSSLPNPAPKASNRPSTAPLAPPKPPPVPHGIQHLIIKLKSELKSRGSLGFIGIQRKFRVMDDDGDKKLNLSEFKKGMKEMNMNLTDSELRMLFDYFDTDHSGTVDFEEFIQGVRDPLNERRLNLVLMAFSKLDRDGNGVVDADEIATAYDASKHPDVLSGKSTPQQVLGHFLDTFDVGGEIDGKVTRQEFVNYYTNLGASIDNNDYFELMIRNAWHISGGEGWAANSLNKRVLVTRSDGSQYVEEIKNDLGLKAGDAKGMTDRLRSQGADVAAVSAIGNVDDDTNVKYGRKMFPKYNTSHIFAPAVEMSAKKPSKTGLSKDSGTGPSLSDAPVSVLVLVSRLKEALKARGAHGFIGLQRKFRVMDDDGNGQLSLAEFKKGMKETEVGLSDTELRMLFQYFDSDGSGSIDFEELIRGVRDPLSDRRLRLVEQAFDKIDLDGSGVVDAQEIASLYDASKHPDVIAGKATAEEVLTHFLETFDVGGVFDGKVTKQEFVNYYTNLGANIDDDDYFELMIRNAWHISGGEGWSANTANKRVLVTRSDGSQYVEEIKNDLGLKQGDSSAVISRLKAQGVDVASVSLFDGAGDEKKPVAAGKPVLPPKGSSINEQRTGKRINNTFKTTVQIAETEKAPTIAKKSKQLSEPTHGIQLILTKLKAELKSHGVNGFISLGRKFRIMDDDGDRSINLGEFKKAMKELNLGLVDAELRMLFEYFDANNSGTIDFEEFVQGVRNPLTERRLRLVEMAFNVIDTDGSGVVDASEIISKYDASRHPDVIAKKKTTEQVLTEWMSTFEVGGTIDGHVTKEEFINYYTNIGANIDNDDYFELMIRNAWHISGGEGWSANMANKRVLVTRSDGSQYVEEIKNDLGLKQGDSSAVISRLKAQGVDVASVSLFDGGDDNNKSLSTRPKSAPGVAAGVPSHGVGNSTTRKLVPAQLTTIDLSFGGEKPQSKPQTASGEAKIDRKSVALTDFSASKTVGSTLDNLRAQLAQRGARGIIGLQRKFKIIDDDGSQSLSYSEFKKGIQECSLTLSDQELRTLFQYFDKDKSGDIDFEEFLQGIRGPPSQRRLNLVNQAFNVLDKDGNGVVEPSDIIGAYDASKHPDVIAKKRTANEVLREFLDTFDVGGVVDGKVTREEFQNYYANVGTSIDDDDYFELMIRNAWHISGGQGWSANSANKRVLVTNSDGSQSVEEIKNDLGLAAGDKAGAIARLRSQGKTASSISFQDLAGDENIKLPASRRGSTLSRQNNPILGGSESGFAPVLTRKNLAHKSQITLG